jgi:hypothetical protein
VAPGNLVGAVNAALAQQSGQDPMVRLDPVFDLLPALRHPESGGVCLCQCKDLAGCSSFVSALYGKRVDQQRDWTLSLGANVSLLKSDHLAAPCPEFHHPFL